MFLLLLVSVSGVCQINLVKNPGLEQYTTCPNFINEISFATNWSCSDTIITAWDSMTTGYPLCSPEYCNTCADGVAVVGVPDGPTGFHFAHSGNGLANVQMFCNSSALDTGDLSYLRDYLQGRLKTRLTAGQEYCVSFWVVLAQASAFAIDKIGAYLDDGTMDTASWCAWPQTNHIPQVYTNVVDTDTTYWHQIEGTFIANGNESFITIGNFFDSAHTDKVSLPVNVWSGGNTLYTWYLVDDVAVIPIDAVANAGTSSWISSTSDSAFIGTNDGYLPCYWYIVGNPVPIDSFSAGFKVHPNVTTRYVMQLNVCGNITTDTVTIWVAPVGTKIFNPERILVYPNPATNNLCIEHASDCELVIRDILGKSVLETHIETEKQSFDIGSLSRGIYFLEITDNQTGSKTIRKITKE